MHAPLENEVQLAIVANIRDERPGGPGSPTRQMYEILNFDRALKGARKQSTDRGFRPFRAERAIRVRTTSGFLWLHERSVASINGLTPLDESLDGFPVFRSLEGFLQSVIFATVNQFQIRLDSVCGE